jgi:hypothetical protein
MSCLFDRLVNRSVDFRIRNITDLPGTAIKECLKPSGNAGPAFGRRNLLWRKSGNADLLVRGDTAAQELLHRGPDGLRQIARSLN